MIHATVKEKGVDEMENCYCMLCCEMHTKGAAVENSDRSV